MTAFGAFLGNNTADLQSYETWLGRPVDQVLSYLDQSSWKAFDSSVQYGIGVWGGSGRPVVWSVPMTVEGTSLADAASGSFDKHFLKAATQLAASRTDDGPIYVRLGWEFNGDWMPWAAGGHEADFIKAFQHEAALFRSVSDQFKFVWDVNIGGGNMDPAKAYPGDAYVDVVGLDLYYNTTWDSSDPQKAFDYSVTRPNGLGWVADFANAHHKPIAISEWGVESNTAGPFIQDLAGWMNTNHVVYANYWESNAGSFSGEMRDGTYPSAGQAFKQTFGHEPAPDTLVLQVSGDSYLGDAQFVVRVDGHQVGGIQTAHASHADGQHDTITLHGDFGATPKALTVEFLNDAWGGKDGLDRNLYVEHVTFDGTAFDGSDAFNFAGPIVGKTAALVSNGTASFDLTHPAVADALTPTHPALADTLTLQVSGDSYQGDAQFVVRVDGQQVGDVQTAHASRAAGQHDTITLTGDFGAHPAAVSVEFLNDAWGGRSGLDRNLYVEHLTFDGVGFDGSAAANTGGPSVGTAAALWNNGTATFGLAHPATGTLTLQVSADSYQGDPQFTVQVDGQQVGGIQTAHASHAAGQQDTITLHGAFDATAQVVTVNFLNDAWGGRSGLDRNLYVEHVSVGSDQATSALASASAETPLYSGGAVDIHLAHGDWHV